ncbi:hypothetical protein [Umezawaea sp.]
MFLLAGPAGCAAGPTWRLTGDRVEDAVITSPAGDGLAPRSARQVD